jgi:hypothetical protein
MAKSCTVFLIVTLLLKVSIHYLFFENKNILSAKVNKKDQSIQQKGIEAIMYRDNSANLVITIPPASQLGTGHLASQRPFFLHFFSFWPKKTRD